MFDDFVTLGRSGLRVSRYALGTFNFGGAQPWSLDATAAGRLIAQYRDLGGNFLDCANSYGGGEAETILGDYLAGEPGLRDRLVIATKFGSNVREGDPNAGGGGRKSILQSVEASLRKLKTDRVDLLWMHIVDPLTPMDETMRALDDLVRAGKVLHVGLSNIPAWKVAEAHWLAQWRNLVPVIGLQLQYSLMERNIEVEHVPLARAYGMGIAAWSPLKSGALSGRYRRDDASNHDAEGRGSFLARILDEKAERVLDVVLQVAERHGASPAQIALAWLQAQPWVATILLGANDADQLVENAAASRITLSAEDLAALDAAGPPALSYPADFARRATGSISGGTRINGIAPPTGGGSPSQSRR
ncbi:MULTISPECIES: aldo/keto reductase [unclassified Sphingobium]|uniref:aldo/keto reductase n=1 Tax=unclassified Sphingobium TaxID=2611147 RepID=UPI002225479D|nr:MULTISPECIES: aldo/keto reductase [unclassified Sphingobium]MCW2381070.1 aryl-alcohol dehydrogenase-like predicted oxidoreductase [Sphingobium sp. B2D3B]MCW2398823.1 aryl-alcohol dehydrogenase-like predicted oxidoreductase [Sphingobium sp. B2D3C]